MRRRLVITTVLIAIVAAVLFGLPIAVFGQRYLQSGRLERIELDAQRVASQVDILLEQRRPITRQAVAAAAHDGERVLVWHEDSLLLAFGPEIDLSDAFREEAVSRDGVRVEVLEPKSAVQSEVRTLWLALAAFGVLAMLAAAALGVWQARRLSRSLVQLADAADRIGGSGAVRTPTDRYGVPELDRVAEVLDQSANRISEMLAAERQLSQDASHQLRTPLTALSMRLEEILATDSTDVVHEEARIALGQVERLSQVVDRLLSRSRDTHTARRVVVPVDSVVDQQVAEWRPAYEAAGRRIEVLGVDGMAVSAGPGTLGLVLATLLENALHHGGGTVRIRRRSTSASAGGSTSGSAVVEVADDGPGIPEALGQRVFERAVSGRSGTGLGLAVARDLAEADGGRLELISRRPAVFAVFLPQAALESLTSSSSPGASGDGETSRNRKRR
jgi:signal transduction histidine kinase